MSQLSLIIHFCLSGDGTELTTVLIIRPLISLLETAINFTHRAIFPPSQILLLLSLSQCIPLNKFICNLKIPLFKSKSFDRTMYLLSTGKLGSVLEHWRYHV